MQTAEKKPSNLKSIHLDHCNKLQLKYQQDAELLEELRIFMRQRAVIEKVYAQSLCKLVQQSLAKRQFPVESPKEVDVTDKSLLEVWKNVLEETRNVAMVRIAAAETYMQKISEQSKHVRAHRMQMSKLVFEELNGVQKDIGLSIQEMSKSQKTYRDDEHLAHEARVKAAVANNKLKTKSVGVFTSLAKLQQQSAKLNSRVESCEVKSTAARNEYILNLAAANAHLSRYYTVDLPDLMKVLDGSYFDIWKYFLELFSNTELQCSSAVTQCFTRISEDANKISRQYNIESYLNENPVLTDVVQYPFIPQDNDPIVKVSKDHQAELDLDREARKWSVRIAKENKAIRESMKTLTLLREENSKIISSSTNILSSLAVVSEVKIEEARHKLRGSETVRAKAEAKIEALRDGEVEVDVWLSSANAETILDDDESQSASGQVTSGENDTGQRVNAEKLNGSETYTNFGSNGDANASSESLDTKAMVYPIWCVAIYDYQAVNEDELTIKEQENLEVFGEGDGDGWMRAKNSEGVEGLVPENYIRMWNPVADGETVDVNEVNVDEGTLLPYAVNNPLMNVNRPHDGTLVPYAFNNPLMNIRPTRKVPTVSIYSEVNKMVPAVSHGGETWAKALFDYDATCEEELSFRDGELIRVIAKEHDGVDDGWWKGETNGSVGLFPSLVVEELLPVRMPAVNERNRYELPQNLYDDIDNIAQSQNKEQDGSLVFNFTKSQNTSLYTESKKSPKIQSLFNDGTESAV